MSSEGQRACYREGPLLFSWGDNRYGGSCIILEANLCMGQLWNSCTAALQCASCLLLALMVKFVQKRDLKGNSLIGDLLTSPCSANINTQNVATLCPSSTSWSCGRKPYHSARGWGGTPWAPTDHFEVSAGSAVTTPPSCSHASPATPHRELLIHPKLFNNSYLKSA